MCFFVFFYSFSFIASSQARTLSMLESTLIGNYSHEDLHFHRSLVRRRTLNSACWSFSSRFRLFLFVLFMSVNFVVYTLLCSVYSLLLMFLNCRLSSYLKKKRKKENIKNLCGKRSNVALLLLHRVWLHNFILLTVLTIYKMYSFVNQTNVS